MSGGQGADGQCRPSDVPVGLGMGDKHRLLRTPMIYPMSAGGQTQLNDDRFGLPEIEETKTCEKSVRAISLPEPCLVVPGDTRGGRYVHGIVSIEVLRVTGAH